MNLCSRVIVSLLIFFSISCDAAAADYQETIHKIRANTASILDYALACDICSERFGGTGEQGFRFRKQLVGQSSPQSVKSAMDAGNDNSRTQASDIIVDRRNGFFSMTLSEGYDDPFPSRLTMAIFSGKDKKKTVALTYDHSGLDSDSYEYHFFILSGTEWKDVTPEVMSSIRLSDFALAQEGKRALNEWVNWKLELPRYGTTATLYAQARYGLTENEQKMFATQIGSDASMKLHWDREKMRFRQGEIVRTLAR